MKPPLPILILDDEVEITKSLARDLRPAGDCETFTDPDAALRALEEREYSVIISDLKMPKMSGLDFLARCAARRPDSQRILLTAFSDLAALADSINRARIHRLLTKPWLAEDLVRNVESCQRAHELLRENAELRRLALTDALTGVANHRYFWERLDSEFSRAQRYKRPLALIMADVDDFKKYNDTHGHPHGDQILRQVADLLEQHRRSMDLVARYGGEEFALILPEVNSAAAVEIARRHLELVRTTGVTLSLGVASYPSDAQSPTELVYAADQALLRAKAAGKARVVSSREPT